MQVTRTYFLNRVRLREEFPQGLKPNFLGPQMSELKLRPPENQMRGAERKPG